MIMMVMMMMMINYYDYDDDNVLQVGLGVIGIGTAATLAATFALAQQ